MSDHQTNIGPGDDEVLWRRLIDTYKASLEASATFLRDARAPLEIVRRALRGSRTSGVEVMAALGLLHRMKPEDRIGVFNELLIGCLSQKFGHMARSLVLSLPRDWLVANVEAAAQPLTRNADYIDYMMLLRLYNQIDGSIARKLAQQATMSADDDIREVGEGFLRGDPWWRSEAALR
jgi:hypothetical protein